MTGRCCARRPNDGVIDPVSIQRAVNGQPASLSPMEMDIVIARLDQAGAGLSEISGKLNYSRSVVSQRLQVLRRGRGGKQ